MTKRRNGATSSCWPPSVPRRPALPKIPGRERLKVVGGVVGQVAERQAQRQEAAALAKAARTERLAIDRAARRVSTQTLLAPSHPWDFKHQREADAELFRG